MTWDEGPVFYGALVEDFTLSYDEGRGDGSLVVLASGILVEEYTLTTVTYGTVYTFQVQARSEYEDLSLYSQAVAILAAQEPAKPEAPESLVEGPNEHGSNVIFVWNAPDSMGSPITAYKLEIQHSDLLTFSEELSYCDASREPIKTALQCNVPKNSLRAEPFNLEWGASIYARVTAINVYGLSEVSEVGNNAQIVTYPDPPINLVEDWAPKAQTTIGLAWEDSAFNGGSAFLDYRISYDQGTNDYVVLKTGNVLKTYSAENLTPGTTYAFKVEVRNRWDYSTYSNELSVLCAFKPTAPAEPTSQVVAADVIIEWEAPFNGGSPITGYRILIQ